MKKIAVKIDIMKKTIILALFSALVFCACREEVQLQNPEDYYNKDDINNTKWSEVFEGFWTGMNNNYVFWDVDPTDWDAVYDKYKPKFDSLGTFGETTSEEFDTIDGWFTEMLENIVDGHYTLTGAWDDPNTKKQFVLRPSLERYKKNFPDDNSYKQSEFFKETSLIKNPELETEIGINSDFVNAVKSTLSDQGKGRYYIFNYSITNDDSTDTFNVATGYTEVNGDKVILYFHFTNFIWSGLLMKNFDDTFPEGTTDEKYQAIDNALQDYTGSAKTIREVVDYYNESDDFNTLVTYLTSYYSSISDSVNVWTNIIYVRAAIDHFYYFFDSLDARQLKDDESKKVCGAIIDIRGNTGGSDVSELWGHIVPYDFTFAKTKYKYGDNRYDYVSELMDWKVLQIAGTSGVTDIPLVLVVNKGSVSCSEIATLFFKALRSEWINPNSYVVGGTTWGGQGPISPEFPKLNNAGQFSVANGIIQLVRTAGLQTRTLSGESFEGKGIPPDIEVSFDYSHMMAGQDDKLQQAIELVESLQ